MSTFDCGDFFTVDEAFERGAARAETSLSRSDLLAILQGTMNPVAMTFEVVSGSKLCDIVGHTSSIGYLVSSRFVDVLRFHGLTGWRAIRTSLRVQTEVLDQSFWFLTLSGRSGPIEQNRSTPVVIKPQNRNGRPMPGHRGLCFEVSTWDGSDLFLPEGSLAYMTTQRAADLLRTAGLSNVLIQRASDVETLDV